MSAGRGPQSRRPQSSRYGCRIDTDNEYQSADESADWWTMADIAAYLSRRHGREVKAASVRRYRARERGGLPAEDRMFGRTPVWRPQTIIRWDEHERRGHGWRKQDVAKAPQSSSELTSRSKSRS